MAMIIRKADLVAQPWKNGGGQTYQLAISPAGAGLTDFDWRLSMAKVGQSGGFSDFSGVDRSLAILAGAGMNLAINGAAAIPLGPQDAPLCFAGEDQIYASLLQGEVLDFNVMTRRGVYTQQLRQLWLDQPASVTLQGAGRIIFLAAGASLLCQQAEQQYVLGQYDSLFLAPGDSGLWHLQPAADVRVLLIELDKCSK